MLEEILYNQNFNEIILNKEHIEPLELLLQKEITGYKSLQKLQLDFKNKVTKQDFPGILKEVKDHVDKELGVTAPDPRYKYRSKFDNPSFWAAVVYSGTALPLMWKVCIDHPNPASIMATTMMTFACAGLMAVFCLAGNTDSYSCASKEVLLNKGREAFLKPVIAHEYAHYLQDLEFDYRKASINSAIEGHARGIQRIVAEHYAKQENNLAYLYHITCETACELASVYVWASRTLGRTISSSLVRNPHRFKKPGSHAIGNATFYVLEQYHGRGIYKRFLKRDLKFLEGK